MRKIPLTLATDHYDHLGPLREGLVPVEGLDVTIVTVASGIRHQRMFGFKEYDAAEFSLGTHILSAARGRLSHQGIPSFPRRMFPHKFFAVRTDRGITAPSDLVGKRVGIPSAENTLQLAVRTMLRTQFQVPVDQINWVAAGPGLVRPDPSARLPFEVIGTGKPQAQMLVDGELDAMVIPDLIPAILLGNPAVTRLFPDVKAAEQDYFRLSGHFPIMHDIVFKRSFLDAYPWAANALFDALTASRRHYLEWMAQPHRLSFAWARELLEEERAVFGPNQWTDGLAANREQLAIMCRSAHEDGLTPQLVDPAELFVESTAAA